MFSHFRKYLPAQDHRLCIPTLSFMDDKTEAHTERGGLTRTLHVKQTTE